MPEATADVATLATAIESGAREMDVALAPGLPDRLAGFVELLERWNHAFNLTAVRDPRDMVARHVLDSLTVLPHLGAGPLLDMGTGAGLPGLVVAMVRPDLPCVLVDSVGKKTRFCQQAVGTLGLDNVRVVTARLEQPLDDAPFGTITARALAPLAKLVDLARIHAGDATRLVAMKGARVEDEKGELRLGADALHCYPVTVPGLDAERFIVTVDGLTENVP